MKYQTYYEKNKTKATIFLVITFIMMLIVVMINLLRGDSMFDDNPGLVLFLIALICSLPSFLAVKRRQIFEAKGKCYSGKILCVEALIGKPCLYYLIIEFYKDGRRLVRRTESYSDNPNRILRSKECLIYEYKGRFLEGGFKTRQSVDRSGNEFIRITSIGSSVRKKKYV